ncbi:MAG: amidohydrolase family protein [Streptosporangiaceae bacterium]
MIDGHLLVDAHLHPVRLPTLKGAWVRWVQDFGGYQAFDQVHDADGTIVPERFDAYLEEQGVDVALLFCEYSPRVTGIQPIEDLLPIQKYNPDRFRVLANLNPHLHHPLVDELERQLGLGAIALKIHPVHGGFSPDEPELFPVYQTCLERDLPVVLHCGTSVFPGAVNRYADPVLLDRVLTTFPGLTLVLAHGGRGWWYDAAAFLALTYDNVWIDIAGLPPKRLSTYYNRYDLSRLAGKFIFGTDWPGVPGIARNARAVADLGLDEETVGLILGGNARRVYLRSETP